MPKKTAAPLDWLIVIQRIKNIIEKNEGSAEKRDTGGMIWG
jgi:hypothetical protein